MDDCPLYKLSAAFRLRQRRNRRKAVRRLRRELMARLAKRARMNKPRCAMCGWPDRDGKRRQDPDSLRDKLQIDHVDGRDWDVTKHGQWTRIRRYLREFEEGVRLRLLCRKCNAAYRPPQVDGLEEQ